MNDAYTYLSGFYDRLTCDVPYKLFADYYEEIFHNRGVSPKTVLDIACGTGTLTKILAERGYDMTASDSSPEMLSVAADKLAGLSVPVLLLCQEMDRLDLNDTVDATICSLDGINYVEPDRLQPVFDRVHMFLSPGGVFVFDINTPAKLRGMDGQIFIDEDEDLFCTWRADYDENDRCCIYGFDIFARVNEYWRRYSEEHIEYSYTTEELTYMLNNAGFVNVETYAELSFNCPTANEQRVFFVASKPCS